jgi:hypothetical protein
MIALESPIVRFQTLAILCLLVFAPAIFARPQAEACNLPPDLQREISTNYPGSKIVTLTDLEDDHRKLFTNEHGNTCPGLVSVDFYGDGKPTLALALIHRVGENQTTSLVIARKVGNRWTTAQIEKPTNGPAPVVWREDPGTYTDIENGKVIHAAKPVIVFCGYNSFAIVHSWTGKRIDKVWLRD